MTAKKNFSSRSKKVVASSTTPKPEETVGENQNNPPPPSNEGEETHENFVKDGLAKKNTPPPVHDETDITPPDLTPKLETPKVTSVMDVATEINAYVGDQRGLNAPPPQPQANPNQTPPPSGSEVPPPGSNQPPPGWKATPPPPPPPPDPADAPEAPPPPPPGAGPTDPFTMPVGTAEEVIEWGFGIVNYGIREFGPYAVKMKFSKGFYEKLPEKLAAGVKQDVKNTAEKNAPRLCFTQEEINMIKKPLAKGMNEAGVKGLTWKEELLAVGAIILAKKATVMGEIRAENRAMADRIETAFEKYYKPEPPPKQEPQAEEPVGEKKEAQDPDVVTEVEFEEVKK